MPNNKPRRTPVHATPLIERVISAKAADQSKVAGSSTPRASKSSPRLITLYEWAEQMFGEHAPHRQTLWKWIADGKIRPIPKKIGRAYFCTPDAEYIDPYAEKRERILSGRR